MAAIQETGQARTVYNLHVEGLHTYHVQAGTTWTTVHNTCTVDKVIKETEQGKSDFTSQYTLTEDEALEAGEKWVGKDYNELGESGSGVFRSSDGTRQFRMDSSSLNGSHAPGVPHFHLEKFKTEYRYPFANNHIPII